MPSSTFLKMDMATVKLAASATDTDGDCRSGVRVQAQMGDWERKLKYLAG